MTGAWLVLVAWLFGPMPCVEDCDTHCSDCVTECVETCEPACRGPRCRRVCVRSCERECGACRRFCLRRLLCARSGGRGDAQPEVTERGAVEPLDGRGGGVVVVEGDVTEPAAAPRRERDHARCLHAAARGEELTQGTVVGLLRKTTYVQRAVL